MCTSEMVNV